MHKFAGTYNQCFCLKKERKKTPRNTFNVRLTENGTHSISMTDAMELGKNFLVPGGNTCILQPPDLNAFPDPNEEVIGIITMEDVMEELLQEEIFDETDEYVNVHNRIKISMLPVIRSSPRTSGPSWRSPVASPRSSYHNTPILRSPIQPFVPSPLARPTLLSSPARSRPVSPMAFSGAMRTSPLRQQGSYEKLRKPGQS